MDDLPAIFAAVKGLLDVYRPPLVARCDDERCFDLWSVKDLLIAGRKRKEVNFATIMLRKGYVGFYFMPVYSEPAMKAIFPPELLGLLKGKSCFHIRTLDATLEEQIRDALAAGFATYQERGWV